MIGTGMNIVRKGKFVCTIVIMKATYLNNVVYGYIKVESHFSLYEIFWIERKWGSAEGVNFSLHENNLD